MQTSVPKGIDGVEGVVLSGFAEGIFVEDCIGNGVLLTYRK
jgi:hypothetical protein